MNLRQLLSTFWPAGQQLNQLFADDRQRVAIFLLPVFSFLTVIAGGFALIAPWLYPTPQIPLAAALIMTAVFGGGAWLVRRGAIHLAGGMVCGVLWLVITVAVLFTGGMRSSAILHYVIVVLLAGLSFGRKGAIAAVVANSLTISALWGWEAAGWLPPGSLLTTPLTYALMVLAILVLTGVILVIVDIQLSAAFSAAQVEITERTRAEQRLRLALLAARAGAWEWEAAARTVRWSPENYPLLGLNPDRDTLTFRRWREQVYADDRAALQAAIDRSIKDRADFDVEFRVVLPDGSLRWLRGIGQPVIDAEGVLQGMYGLQIDVTARKTIEARKGCAVACFFTTVAN
ncbi:PAS domain-containing protein [Chloroflexus islandicus]|uniref:PAS domain-containing protein n=1 Tax=Chloroflexus islandicus TaxID=1707952 RepID=UPI000ACD7B0D|nr:PAS domain-containing protein [Chloroflexus islandicus]